MKPQHFVILAILAAVSTVLAITSYAANNTWSPGSVSGARMLPALSSNAATIAAIELRQGAKILTVEKADGGAWRLKERGGYPVAADKVRALMVSLAEADLAQNSLGLACPQNNHGRAGHINGNGCRSRSVIES